ncbi:hypothetical protein DFQ00_11197 [Paenibacillus barcinonensis]|uniref:Inositol monophosphatase n=1 Tax=Paenibacillus barcinonensis TaxID=198119 RepID=A0A2V4VGD7_PAEBA|nr:hypothetical protein DFQ00_11197 [Paenibacillus barcinonensis]
MENTLQAAQELAERAARKAGEVARMNFDRITSVIEKDIYGDMVTDVDHEAE